MIAILAENDAQNDTREVKMILKSVFIANSFGIYHYSITFAPRNIKSSVTNCTNRAGMPRWSSYDVDKNIINVKKISV